MLVVLLLLAAGCVVPQGSEPRPFAVDTVSEIAPVSMHDAWHIAEAVAQQWGGEVYTMSSTETIDQPAGGQPEPGFGDGIADVWRGELRDPITTEGLGMDITAGGVLEYWPMDAGAMRPASTWQDTPPPGDAWLARVHSLPSWSFYKSEAVHITWIWDTHYGMSVEYRYGHSNGGGGTARYTHDGWTTQAGMTHRVLGDEDVARPGSFTVDRLSPTVHFTAREDQVGQTLALTSPDGQRWEAVAGQRITIEAPAPGYWSIEDTGAVEGGWFDVCFPGYQRQGGEVQEITCE